MSDVTAVVPVKRLDAAKSRLALPPAQRRDLALAVALDTVEALVGCEAVAAASWTRCRTAGSSAIGVCSLHTARYEW